MAPPILESRVTMGDVKSRWYKALYEEDCMEVMKLLDADPRLVKVGWESDLSVTVKGRRVNFWMEEGESVWKGRTALHVGARRGCAMLVKQVMMLRDGWGRFSEGLRFPIMKHLSLENIIKYEEYKNIIDIGVVTELVKYEFTGRVENWYQGRRLGVTELLEQQEQKFRHFEEEDEDHGSMSNKTQNRMLPDHSDLVQGEEELRENVAAGSSQSKSNEMRYKGSVLMAKLREVLPEAGAAEGTADESPRSQAFARWERRSGKENDGGEDEEAGMVDWIRFSHLKDGEYGLDTFAMAYLNGNNDVLSLLLPRHENAFEHEQADVKLQLRARLRSVTEGLIERIRHDPLSRQSYGSIFQAYSKHRDFNFLPWEEFLFHFLFSTCFRAKKDDESVIKAGLLREYLWLEVWWDSSSERDSSWKERDSLWSFLLKLQDGQGRTPLHYAVDEGTVQTFVDIFHGQIYRFHEFEEAWACALTVCDTSGRTALHRATALGRRDAVATFIRYRRINSRMTISSANIEQGGTDRWINTVCNDFAGSFDVDLVSDRNGFEGHRFCQGRFFLSSAVHSAVIHGSREVIEELGYAFDWGDIPFYCDLRGDGQGPFNPHSFNTLELAALVGNLHAVKFLLPTETFKFRWKKILDGAYQLEKDDVPDVSWQWPIVHFAASHGKYQMLKAILEFETGGTYQSLRRLGLAVRFLDVYAEDAEGNTALHHAMKMGNLKFETHLLDYVSCEHLRATDPRKLEKRALEINHPDSIIQRQGCINLLLQLGYDVFKQNKAGQIPYPSGELGTNASFLSWWYGIQSKEFEGVRNTLSFATNAVAVTATLVATASYVGPLQPPLGYDQGSPNQIQANYAWVRIFLVCDTLSFYLAVASITFSLIPSLPMPQQPMRQELRRTRVMVTLATGILFPSIICILVAFAASSIAVTSSGVHGISSPGAPSTIVTSSIGGFACLLGFILFFIRLLGFVFPRNSRVRKIYDATSF